MAHAPPEPLLRITECPEPVTLAVPIECRSHPGLGLPVVDPQQVMREPVELSHIVRFIEGQCVVVHLVHAGVIHTPGAGRGIRILGR